MTTQAIEFLINTKYESIEALLEAITEGPVHLEMVLSELEECGSCCVIHKFDDGSTIEVDFLLSYEVDTYNRVSCTPTARKNFKDILNQLPDSFKEDGIYRQKLDEIIDKCSYSYLENYKELFILKQGCDHLLRFYFVPPKIKYKITEIKAS